MVAAAVTEAVSEGVEVDLEALVIFEFALVVDVWTGTTSSAELVALGDEVSGSRRLLMPLSMGSKRNDILCEVIGMIVVISGVSKCCSMASESLYSPDLAM